MKRIILLISAIALLFTSCDKDPIPTYLTIHFTHTVDGIPLELTTTNSELPYTNAAGQNYNIKTLQYLVSNFQMHGDFGGFYEEKVYFVDAAIPSTLKIELGELTNNSSHDDLQFNIGVPHNMNISNNYVNEDFHTTMAWPDMMGGGYHYMILEGNFDNDTTFYNTHTGGFIPGWISRGIGIREGCPSFDMINFNVDDELGNVEITLNMELNKWYNSPDIISLTSDGIMGNDSIQAILMNNGSCIFSNSVVYE
ncbi:MAG TPA: hypothetical protein EYQ09_02185 [Flavobacteriales bacterium]|nr:hypothetical protein [Flavobacteriales bacterium]